MTDQLEDDSTRSALSEPPSTAYEGAGTVAYSFGCEGVADAYVVVRFEAVEELSHPYQISLQLRAVDDHTDSYELLGKSVRVTLERGDHQRNFCGIVSRVAVIDDEQAPQTSVVEVVPALAALALTRNTRVFQDKSVLEIVTSVLQDALGPYRRECDTRSLATESYWFATTACSTRRRPSTSSID